MRDIFTLFLHSIVSIIRLAQPGGLRAVVAESVLMRHQVLILNRGRKRAPNLRSCDRIIAGLCTLLMRPARVLRSAVALKTSTLLHFHKMLIQQKYRLLFSPKRVRRPGPKGPTKELIDAVVEMKRRNATWAANELPSKLPSLSASTSTRTWSAGFSQPTSIRMADREVHPGFHLSGTLKTRCGRWICFDANRRYYERTGSWS